MKNLVHALLVTALFVVPVAFSNEPVNNNEKEQATVAPQAVAPQTSEANDPAKDQSFATESEQKACEHENCTKCADDIKNSDVKKNDDQEKEADKTVVKAGLWAAAVAFPVAALNSVVTWSKSNKVLAATAAVATVAVTVCVVSALCKEKCKKANKKKA